MTIRGDAMRSAFSYLSVMAVFAFFVAPTSARRIENWPYERLFKDSDLVIIGTAESTADTKDRFKNKEWNVEFIGQETTLTVRTALKGDMKGKKKVQVLHYRLPNGVKVENGPLLVSFRKKPLSLKGTINGEAREVLLGRPDYLLFLRARPDGRFELISGQVDPALSVRELRSWESFLSELDGK
jgi:hypothetical protein